MQYIDSKLFFIKYVLCIERTYVTFKLSELESSMKLVFVNVVSLIC